MDATKLEKLNETLAALPVRGDYNLQVFLADEPAYLKTHQQRLRVALGQAPSPRTTLRLDSAETAQRLMAGGKRAAIGLLAQGKLRLEGDLGQLEELRQELAPHGPSLEQAAEALMSSDTADPKVCAAPAVSVLVRWLPNEAADCCMSESCGRAFTLLRRRHHCRGCGRIFCDACAPPRGSPPERRCGRCWSARRGVSGPPAAGLPTPAPMPEPEAPIAKSQSTTELLVEFHVEDALNGVRFWRRGVFGLSLAATAYLVAALRSQERLLLSPFLLLAFFLRRWLLRYAEVGWMCLVILCKVLSARMRCSQRPALAAEAIWALCHKVNARFLFDTVVSLGGFWVKLAQTASVMSALPDAYVEELSKLQDAMPADSLEDVEALLSQELGPKWRERIRLDTGPVLGSATIAQVHRATFLGPEGQELPGVIKVQHRGVEEKLLVDISASVMMGRVLTWLIPHLFSDLSSTIQDTAEMSKAELDFRVEAKSQTLAREKILDAGLDVLVPKVIEEFVTKRVLAMDFVKGVKITEYAGAGVSKQQRTEVLAKLINFYGFTLHGPIFNCDPHPGNLLVEKETGRLCVLDWGQVRQLAQPERFAYAKIFMASMTEDVHLFVEGCKTLGFEFQDMDGKPDPTPIVMINALRFLLRDSRPIAQSRADFVQLEQVFGKLDGETKAIQTGGEQIVKGPLMPLTKTVSLLFEVSSRLDVSLPLMHMFVCHGYPMLLKEMGHGSVQARPSQGSFVLEPSHAAGGASAAPRLAAELLQLLEELHARGRILGAQLCVLDLETGDTLADLALGHCSWLRPVPVTSKTIFNILEISKMFLAFSVLRLVDQKRLQLSTALQDSALGKVTVEQALSHTSGHLKCAPGSSDLAFRDFCDAARMGEELRKEEPLLKPGLRQQYHHACGLWSSEACKKARTELEPCWSSFMEEAGGSVHLRAPSPASAPAGFAEPVPQMRSPSLEDLSKRMVEFEHFVDATNRGRAKTASQAEKAENAMWMSFFGREHWFNPAALNRELPRSSLLPGLQAFATAKDTAQALRGAKRLLSPTLWREASRSRRPNAGEATRMPHHLECFREAEWGLGLQLLTLPDGTARALGHCASNGSVVAVLPGARPLVAAFLVNRSDGFDAQKEVLAALVRHAGATEPAASG
ncbi:unnamed protein product [Effrenium voratum]|uniref:FYVE-type domain-containing protein n=1 Tax=Effrenium voratum TaxID=2562239 RepID=A0AA36MSQ2_9DINO|nr:unnamed protein product [Effrenium voratum]